MANQWLRLWHDMPNDPKFKTVARVSKRPITEVLSVYLHLLVDASRNVTRGHVTIVTEDLSSALDILEEHIISILGAMEGRLICEKKLTGWEARQPKNEDAGNPESGAKSALERKRDQRNRERQAREFVQINQNVTKCHDVSRNVTLDKDKDKDKEYIKEKSVSRFVKPSMLAISEYFAEIGSNPSDHAQRFFDHYESVGWCVGKAQMKCWKAAIRKWVDRDKKFKQTPNQPKKFNIYEHQREEQRRNLELIALQERTYNHEQNQLVDSRQEDWQDTHGSLVGPF